MHKNYKRLNILKFCCISSFCFTSIAIAQQSSGDIYAITQYTIDNGGGVSQGGQFSLSGTIGQTEAHQNQSFGSIFSLRGGIWSAYSGDLIFKDGFETL